jgi:endonuclease V-like protein UPF0215 family
LLKRESRILGLSASTIGSRVFFVGVVFRGSLWLDGIVTSSTKTTEPDYGPTISNMIKSARQFSQLHAITVSRRLARSRKVSIHDLAKKVKLPVIATARSTKGPGMDNRRRYVRRFGIVIGGKHATVFAAGVDREQAERLFGIGCRPCSKVPEAVRIADLLTAQLIRGRQFEETKTKLTKVSREYKS